MKRIGIVAVVALIASGIGLTVAPAAADQGQWLAGDLHIHTTYSHDSYGGPGDDNTGPDEFYTLGHSVRSQFEVAAARGLDYLAITDHNDIRSQKDPGWGVGGIIPVRGYENSLRGHAQVLGTPLCYDSSGSYEGPDCGRHGDTSTAGVNATAAAIRADGGIFQANHPMEGTTDHGATPDWGYGYDVIPDTVEVWNIARLWQPPMPSASSNDDAIRYWEGFLDRGYKVGATGGSDNHYLATTPVQGAGQPTTWVFANETTEEGVIEGLRAGRTFISHQPPNHGGPQIYLEADGDGNGTFESIVGDTVAAGSSLRVRVVDGAGSLLSIFTDGGRLAIGPVPVVGPDFERGFMVDERSTWVRAEIADPDAEDERRAACDDVVGSETTYCRNRALVLAMTSALYLQPVEGSTETYSSGGTYAHISDTGVVAGNDLVERRWRRSGFGTTSLVDERDGSKVWAAHGDDFHIDLGTHELASSDFLAHEVTVTPLGEDEGLRIAFELDSETIAATRVVEIYDGVAGFRTRTILHPSQETVLLDYTLDEIAVGGGEATIHAFRSGADWRDPERGWDGPRIDDSDECREHCPVTSVGDPHAGTWHASQTGERGEAVAGPAQWVSVADGARTAFLVMERNDQPSSHASYDGNIARLTVDLSRDVINLGPFEEQVHVENPTPSKARHRLLVPGSSLPLEPAFLGFGSHEDDEPWQFHKYLRQITPQYPFQVTFNSNGTDSNRISTGAKDDMDYDTVVATAERAHALGIETFILDDGWQAISGDWCPDSPECPEPRDGRSYPPNEFPARFPDSTFTAVREAIAPMKLGLWMSPTFFNPASKTYQEHPDWACAPVGHALAAGNAIDQDGRITGSSEAGIGIWGPRALTGGVDVSAPTYPDNLPEQSIEARIRNAIQNWGVTYFKFDFLVWVDCAGQGDLYDYREAFMAMLDRLIADHPEVTFQIDETNDYRLFPFESVTRGPSWFQNGHPEPKTLLHNLWNLSPFIPTYSLGQDFLGNLDSVTDNGIDTTMAAALLSHMTYFNELVQLKDGRFMDAGITDDQLERARVWIDFRKQHAHAFDGVVYPLLDDPLKEGWTALQSWDPEAGIGALLAFRQDDDEATKRIALRNIPPGMSFDLLQAPDGIRVGTVTSAQLTEGIEVALSKRGAQVLVIRPAQGPVRTAIEYTGPEVVAVGRKASLSAQLTTSGGDLLSGRTVTFTFQGTTVSAPTIDGIATVEVHVRGPIRSHPLAISFAGDTFLLPSRLDIDLTVAAPIHLE